jgi:hypothetical protein
LLNQSDVLAHVADVFPILDDVLAHVGDVFRFQDSNKHSK